MMKTPLSKTCKAHHFHFLLPRKQKHLRTSQADPVIMVDSAQVTPRNLETRCIRTQLALINLTQLSKLLV